MMLCHHRYVKPKVIRILSQHKDGNKLLDIGCNDGSIMHDLGQLGYELVGIDISEKKIRECRKKYPDFKFICKDICNLTVKDTAESFDIVTAIEVIEHIEKFAVFIDKIKCLLKPKGLLLMTTPYHGYTKNLLIALAAKNNSHYNPFGGHIRFFSVKTLRALLENAGFCNIKFYGAGRVPFIWKSMVVTCMAP